MKWRINIKKTCVACGESKSIYEFYFNNQSCTFERKCKVCRSLAVYEREEKRKKHKINIAKGTA